MNLTCVFLKHMYIPNFNWKCPCVTEIMRHYLNFSKSKGNNSAENYSTETKLDLNCVFSWHIHIPNFKMFICDADNERKPIHIGIFLSPNGKTPPKINRPDPYSKSTCLFSWHIYIIGARLMHVGDSSIYLNWLLEKMYNKVPNSNSGKNYELF